MSDAVYSEINLHITWHTKGSLPMLRKRTEERLFHFITHKIIETAGVILHAIGGTENHIHLVISIRPDVLISDWLGKLKGSSAYYINHKVEPKALQWQRGYGVVSFGTKDLPWVVEYVKNQTEHHSRGTTHERLERSSDK